MSAKTISIIAAMLMMVPLPSNAQSTPLEPDILIGSSGQYSEVQLRQLIDPMVTMIQAWGYRCDSVSSVRSWILSTGFTIICNRYSYKYEVSDKGGKWVVELQ